MAVDVSRIPNNNKFDPVREAILDLQTQLEEEGQIAYDGTLTLSEGTAVTLTGGSTFTANQSGDTTITIGVDLSVTTNAASGGGSLSYLDGEFTYTPPDLTSFIELTDLSITTSSTPSGGGALSYDDTTGVFTFTPADAGTGLTLQQVTANGNTTNYGISTGNITVQPSGTGSGIVTIQANSVGDARLDLTAGTGGTGVIKTTNDVAITFEPNATEKVVIASDGNMNVYEKLAVGKTTAAATYHLEVDGTALANNFITSMTASGTTYTGTVSQYYNALQIRTGTGGTISLGGSGPLSVQNNVAIKDGDLDVNGDVTADFFIGDGSQLTNIAGTSSDLQDVTDNGATTTNGITAASFTGDGSGLTSVDADTLDGYQLDGTSSVSDRIFNNKGLAHSTFTDFDTVMNAGANYLQAGTNGPTGNENDQWYGFMLGLGSDYNTTTGNTNGYASQLYWNRQSQGGSTYLWARDLEAGTWGSWRKMSAGNADNAGTLNGVAGSSFLRSDADDTATGKITINNNSNSINDPTLTISSSQGGGSFGRLMFSGTSTVAGVINRSVAGSHLYFDEDATTGKYFFRSSGRAVFYGSMSIGTTEEDNLLNVRKDQNTGSIGYLKNLDTGTSSYAEFIVRSVDSNNDLRLGTSKSYTDTQWQGGWVFAPRKLLLKSNNDVSIFAGGTDNSDIVATFTSNGNVGVGTTTPSLYGSGMEIKTGGQSALRLSSTTAGGGAIEIGADGAQGYIQNVTIGDSTRFYVSNSSDADTLAMSIKSDGSVGIGESNPSYTLDVRGTVRLGNTEGNNNVIRMGVGTNAVYMGAANINTINVGYDEDNDDYNLHLNYRGYQSGNTRYRSLVINDGKTGQIARFVGSTGRFGIGVNEPLVKFHVAGQSIIANNTEIDPDLYTDTVVAGGIADGSGFVLRTAIGGNAGTGDSWAIGAAGNDNFYMGFGNGSSANTLQTFLQVGGNRHVFLVPSSGNVGVGLNGTSAPRQKLVVDGHAEVTALNSFKASYNNTDSYHGALSWATLQLGNNGDNRIIGGRTSAGGNLSFYVNNTNDATQYSTTPNGILAMRIASSGDVGIGTTTPSAKLEVADSTTSSALLITSDGGNEQVKIRRYSNNNEQLILGFHSSDYAQIQAVEQGVAYRPLALNPNGGNVGIGSTTPNALLSVGSGSLADSNLKVQISTGGSGTQAWYGVNKDGGYGLIVGYTNGAGSFGTGSYYRNVTSDPMYFVVNNTTLAMAISNAGEVSVGSTVPLLPSAGRGNLSVNGSSDSVVTLGVGGAWSSYYYTNGSATFLASKSGTPIHLEAGGSTKMFISSGGAVGIGTNSPAAMLDVRKNDGAVSLLIRNGDVNTGGNNEAQIQLGYNGTNSYSHFIRTRHNSADTGGNAIDFYTCDSTQNNSITSGVRHNLTLDSGVVAINKTSGYADGGFGSPKFVIKQTADSQWGGMLVEASGNDAILAFGTRTDGHYISGSYRTSAGYKPLYFSLAGSTRMTLSTAGVLSVTGDIIAYSSSDKRLKDNITPIPNALDKVSAIGGYEFDWNDNQETYEGHDVGVIAQEVEEVMPEVVTTREDGYKAVKYEKMVPLLIEAIKEQQKQIDELKARLDAST